MPNKLEGVLIIILKLFIGNTEHLSIDDGWLTRDLTTWTLVH